MFMHEEKIYYIKAFLSGNILMGMFKHINQSIIW